MSKSLPMEVVTVEERVNVVVISHLTEIRV